MRPSKSRSLRLAALALAAWVAAMDAASAQDAVREYRIAGQSLGQALREFALASNLDLLFSPDLVAGKKSVSLDGKFTVDEGLRTLLRGSGLEFSVSGSRVVISEPKIGPSRQATSSNSALQEKNGHTRLAQAENPPFRSDAPATTAAASSEDSNQRRLGIEEVVVTAQKKEERLQDVPVPVTAIPSDSLVNAGQRRLEDYYNKIPGLSLTQVDDGFTSVAIRGVTAGGIGSSPTVATVVDDIPFGATFVVNGFGEAVSDFDPSELTRAEVLRGPQGTLYGASSMGGLIKYVTVDPSVDRLAGQVRVGANSVYRGDEGYDVLGAINIPVTDTFAVRASGSARRDPGYIDNIFAAEDNVNRLDSQTARLVGIWLPSAELSVKLSALYQHSKRGGSPEVDLASRADEVDPATALGQCPVPEDLQQCNLRDTGWQKQEFQAYSAIITQHWGSTELTSLTGYSIKNISNLQDYSPSILGTFVAPTFFSVGGFTINGRDEMTKLSQELRLSTPLSSRIEWMLGLFYTRENRHTPYVFQAVDPVTLVPSSVTFPPDSGLPGGLVYVGDDPQGYKEYAVFTDFTFKLTDRFDVQIGGRGSHNELRYTSTSTGLINIVLAEPFVRVLPEFTSTDDPFTYLLSPRFRVSPELMLYARFASGYRPGGFNINPTIRAQGHPDFTHDATQSYELGAKGKAWNGSLTFDASLYYIDWKDIQLQLTDPTDVTVKYILNAGEAASKGAELALTLNPIEGLDISAWGNFNDATLTSVPANISLTAQDGDRLPYSARWTGGLSVDQRFGIPAGLTGFVGASLTYVGDRKGQFLTGGLTQGTFPAYTQVDVRGGVAFDAWRVDGFISNVTDKRGVLRNGHDSLMGLDYRATYIRPRTIGISLTRSF